MFRVITYPPRLADGPNPYGRLFQRAMAEHGVEFVGDLVRAGPRVQNPAGAFDAAHFHWSVEDLWRTSRGFPYSWKRVADFYRLLRGLRRAGKAVLWTVHNLAHHEGATRVDRVGYGLLGRAADLCLFHSDWARREFRAGRSDRAVVMPHGNYDGAFPPAAPAAAARLVLGIPADRRVVLCLGLLRPYKGLEVAAGAVGRLGDPYHLVVAGPPAAASGPGLVDRLAEAAGGRLTALPRRLSDQEVADLHAAADCVALPYHRVTGSGAILTAATLGRGVVASDLPYFREQVAAEPGMAELFAPGDPGDLARAVGEFFRGPAGERHAAARRLADRYPWGRVVEPVVGWLRRHGHLPPAPAGGR